MGKVYIKNFRMPDGCLHCAFAEWDYCWIRCIITKKVREDDGECKRPRGCPLYEVDGRKNRSGIKKHP